MCINIKKIMGEPVNKTSDPVVQYIIIRTDLKSSLKWSYGAIMAQACHASVAAIHTFYSDEHTQAYLNNLEHMHKIILQVPDDESLQKIHDELKSNTIDFYQWLEKPDDINTCVALRPYPKSAVENYFKNLKLFRN
ncbi:putative peptidyl-tRNA hydrolase PTRHD1 isoform X2 [Lycorma delicatula]|uniref:putative peptidyl-tRNA hydrolase PTRHD1 isoform X2 n=1 Tax=Lycorma delicatula TaxID=130591 RepID=UPI003F51621A